MSYPACPDRVLAEASVCACRGNYRYQRVLAECFSPYAQATQFELQEGQLYDLWLEYGPVVEVGAGCVVWLHEQFGQQRLYAVQRPDGVCYELRSLNAA